MKYNLSIKLTIKKIKLLIQYVFLLCSLSFHGWGICLVPVVDNGQLLRPKKSAFFIYGQSSYQQKRKVVTQMWNWDLIARLDQGLSFLPRNMNIRYFLGMGRSGWQGGTFLKWIPLSDYTYLPATGINVGISWRMKRFWKLNNSKNSQSHFLETYIQPLMSKEFSTVYGPIIPYLSTPFIFQTWIGASNTEFLMQVVFGLRGELPFIYFHKFEFNTEIAWGVTKQALNYISLGIITRL